MVNETIYNIYDWLLSYSARKEWFKFYFFLCNKFPRLSAEYDRRMDAFIEEAMREQEARLANKNRN